jgi:hypothetical protein
MIGAVVIFVVGSAIQAGAINIAMLFVGKLDEMPRGSLILIIIRAKHCWICCGNAYNGHSLVHLGGK